MSRPIKDLLLPSYLAYTPTLMSRRSRRKTLSHAEIENFLFDLQEDDVVKPERAVQHVDVPTPPAVDDIATLKSTIRNIYKVTRFLLSLFDILISY